MEYQEGMDQIDETIMNRVLDMVSNYDYDKYTASDVLAALDCETIDIQGMMALLSPAALPLLEQMAQRAMKETRKHFGNTICMFTPLYIANYFENYCVY